MPLSLSLGNLASRAARSAATNGSGIRRFAVSALGEQASGDGGNIITKVWNGFSRFAGFLISGVISQLTAVFQWSVSALVGLLFSTVQFIWTFNWNASDEQLDQNIQGSFDALGGTLGGTIGNALGHLVCGVLPGAAIFAFNEPMGLYVLKNVSEEMLDDMAGNIANLIKQTALTGIRAGITFAYKNVRRAWREPDGKVRAKLKASGMNDEKINAAMAERNKPWSFASATEDLIESLPDGFIQNFAEEMFEEFTEACMEAGYAAANSVDSYIAMQKMGNDATFGRETTVEILLNRDADD